MILRIGLCGVLVVVLLGTPVAAQRNSPAAEDAPAAPMIRGGAELQGTVDVATNISRDRRQATVHLGNLYAEVGGVEGGRSVDHRATTVHLAVDAGDKPLEIQQTVRGYVETDEGARPVLVVQSAGETHLVDVSEEARRGDNFEFVVKGTLPANSQRYAATFMLLAERDTDSADIGAYVEVNSLHLEIQSGE